MAQGPPYYYTAANKWLPIHLGPQSWQVTTLDEHGNRIAAQPPPGEAVYWWLQPKETWPYRSEMPWEGKLFGAWPASKITMPEDLRYVWPGQRRPVPPWGYIKVKMPGTPDASGDQTPKGNQILFMNMKIHMRWISPDEMKVKTAITPMGPRYYAQSSGWSQHEYDYREFRTVLRMRRRGRVEQMLAPEIMRTRGQPKPHKDLFS